MPKRVLLAHALARCPLVVASACALIPSPPAVTPVPPTDHLLTRTSDRMVTIGVSAGSFVMGSTDAEVDRALQLCNEAHGACRREWFEDEQPAHEVALDGFHIDQTEVTSAQFVASLNAQSDEAGRGLSWAGVILDLDSEHSLIEQVGDEFRPDEGYAGHPVTMVSRYGARTYCEWVGAQLPSEAEWAYAARGPDRAAYPWGDTFDGSHLNYCDANCALDMAGNVWEWVADRYADDYYARSPARNPQGPDTGKFRVQRGGSWTASLRDARSARRHRYPASWQDDAVGFRCASALRQDLAAVEVLPATSAGSRPW